MVEGRPVVDGTDWVRAETNLTDTWVKGRELYTTQANVSGAIPLSQQFYNKYAPLLLRPPPPPNPHPPSPPSPSPSPCNTTDPAGFVRKVGSQGYWKPFIILPL